MNAVTAVQELSLDRFDVEVLQSPLTVLVEFRTAWCPPCREFAPVLEKIAADYSNRLKIFTVDVEQSLDFARQFRIEAVPTLLIYKNGQLTHRQTGTLGKRLLLEKLGFAPEAAVTA